VLKNPSRFKYTLVAYLLFLKNPIIERICKSLSKPLVLSEPQLQTEYKHNIQRCWIALQTGNIDESIKFSKSIAKEQSEDTIYHVTRIYTLAQCYALKGQEVEALELMHEGR